MQRTNVPLVLLSRVSHCVTHVYPHGLFCHVGWRLHAGNPSTSALVFAWMPSRCWSGHASRSTRFARGCLQGAGLSNFLRVICYISTPSSTINRTPPSRKPLYILGTTIAFSMLSVQRDSPQPGPRVSLPRVLSTTRRR